VQGIVKKGLLDVPFTVQYLVIVSTRIKVLEIAMYGKHMFFADSEIRGVTILLLSLKGTVSRVFSTSDTFHHKVLIYKEHHSVCPFVGIGTLPPLLSPASVPLPPVQRGVGARSPAGGGVGESQFRRLEKKLSTLSTL
jgi:hypothetical protein